MAIKDKLVSAALGFMTPPEQFEKMYNAKIKSGEKQEERAFDLKKIQFQEGLKQQNKLDYAKLYGKKDTAIGGYDRPEDVPKELNGLPLTKLSQREGKHFGEYGVMSDDIYQTMRKVREDSKLEKEKAEKEKQGNQPGMFEKMFGNKSAPSNSAAKTVLPYSGAQTSYNRSTGERLVLNPQTNQWEKPKNAA